MSDLLRPLLVLLTFLAIVVVLLLLIFGAFSGGDDDGADKAETKTATTGEVLDEPPKPGNISAQDLKVGNCIADARSTSGDVKTFDKVDCDKPHDGEVYTLIKLEGAKYRGRKFVTAKANRGCRARLKRQATLKALRDRNLAPYRYVYPTAASWAQEYRSVTCLVTFTKARKGAFEQK